MPTGLCIGAGVARSGKTGLAAFGSAVGLGAAHLLPGLAIISANAWRIRNCDYGEGLAFFALLPLSTSLYAAALGVLVGRLCADRKLGLLGLGLGLTALAPLAVALAELYLEPPIFAYDHLWGYFAGSLYDEAMRIGTPLVMLRLGTTLRLVAVAVFLVVWERRAATERARVAGLTLALVSLCVLYERGLGPIAGFRVSRADVERALPLTLYRPGLVIHVPAALAAKDRDALADEHSFALERVSARLGVTRSRPIHSYVYANANDKARLMGGRATMIAKPWLHEIHIHDVVVPHPVLAHELAHAVAAELAPGPLHVSARFGLLVNIGLIEGLAEAVTTERRPLDLDTYARAMRDLKILPDVREIVGPAGFWTEAGPRAYAAVGSFVRFLNRRYGAAALARLYPHADFEAAYGKPLAALVDLWQRTLDEVSVAPRETRIVEQQLQERSMFARTCAREVAQLREAAAHASPQKAVAIFQQISTHLSHAPSAELEVANALERAADETGFLDKAAALLDAPGLNAGQRGGLFERRADLLWRRGDVEGARTGYTAALELAAGFDGERMNWVKRWALDQEPELRATLRDFLMGKLPPLAATLTLDAAAAHSDDRTLPYLIARQLVRVDAWERALPYLQRAAPHPFAPIDSERRRLVAECLFRLGRLEEASRAYEAFAAGALVSGERAQGEEWVARLRFLEARQERPPLTPGR
ncbi:MAG: hypothetical protein HY903_25155 [Deltaproteobacteria bacterium]|nr:hypothetical protein [Deltaproteobacteria bacterium]